MVGGNKTVFVLILHASTLIKEYEIKSQPVLDIVFVLLGGIWGRKIQGKT
jgi:hypothetical protein